MGDTYNSYESVEEYLASVKLEANSLPNIGISSERHTESKKLDHPEYTIMLELNKSYDITLESGKWEEYFSLLRKLVRSKYSRQYISVPSSLVKYIKENHHDWKGSVINPPPPLETICAGGIHFDAVQEGVEVIKSELEKGTYSIHIFEWAFYLLTIIDDLHVNFKSFRLYRKTWHLIYKKLRGIV